jgi:hypothetical protein
MPVEARELYSSSNGDRGHLVLEPHSGRVFIRHEPNAASGGDVSCAEVGDFLRQGHGPQHDEFSPMPSLPNGPFCPFGAHQGRPRRSGAQSPP